MKKSFISEWYARIQAETPVFFQKMSLLGAMLITIGGIPTSLQAMQGMVIPEPVITAAHYALTIGITMVTVAKAACSKPETVIDEKK